MFPLRALSKKQARRASTRGQNTSIKTALSSQAHLFRDWAEEGVGILSNATGYWRPSPSWDGANDGWLMRLVRPDATASHTGSWCWGVVLGAVELAKRVDARVILDGGTMGCSRVPRAFADWHVGSVALAFLFVASRFPQQYRDGLHLDYLRQGTSQGLLVKCLY